MLSYPFDLCFFGLCVMDKSKVPASMAWFQWQLGAFGSKAFLEDAGWILVLFLPVEPRAVNLLSNPVGPQTGPRWAQRKRAFVVWHPLWIGLCTPALALTSPRLFSLNAVLIEGLLSTLSVFSFVFCMRTVPPSVHVESNHVKGKKKSNTRHELFRFCMDVNK